MHVVILGLLVLSRGLMVEIEERWPWPPRRARTDHLNART
jgi:hypothetical protein